MEGVVNLCLFQSLSSIGINGMPFSAPPIFFKAPKQWGERLFYIGLLMLKQAQRG